MATPLLIVDDELDMVQMLTQFFGQQGGRFLVETATDGYEALIKAAALRPAVVVLDVVMPRLVYRHVPVVVLTTSAEDRDIKRSYELGASSYIVKPVEFEKFRDVVERIDLYWIVTNVPYPAGQSS